MLPATDYALALSIGIGIGWTVKKISTSTNDESKSIVGRRLESSPKCVGSQQNEKSTTFENKKVQIEK